MTFALAIGANSAIFSAVNTVLLRPLPVEAPENLAVVWQTDAGGRAVIELTYRHLREWTAAGQTFTRAAVLTVVLIVVAAAAYVPARRAARADPQALLRQE